MIRFGYLKSANNGWAMNSKNRNDESVLMPQIDGEWWDIAGNPDLGHYTAADSNL